MSLSNEESMLPNGIHLHHHEGGVVEAEDEEMPPFAPVINGVLNHNHSPPDNSSSTLLPEIDEPPVMDLSGYSAENARLILTKYGQLTEGLQGLDSFDQQKLQRFRRRFEARRNLAYYSVYPEGYVFLHQLSDCNEDTDNKSMPVVLLTPPDFIAIQNADGTWRRKPRVEADGPSTYTHTWYFQYLVRNNLPRYFMRPELASLLWQETEAANLGLEDDSVPEQAAQQVPSNYLNARFPVEPRYPVPRDEEYQVYLETHEIAAVARRFPAVLENWRRGDHRVYVAPSGHIAIRERTLNNQIDQQTPRLDRAVLGWTGEDAQGNTLASYVVQGQDVTETAGELSPSSVDFITPPQDRSGDIFAIPEEGYIDIQLRPNGPGRYTWLNPAIDAPLAAAMNLSSPQEVAAAVRNGVLVGGIPEGKRPRTVYTPSPAYLNPRRAPTQYGEWKYFTEGESDDPEYSSEATAHANLGGLAPYCSDLPKPSAVHAQFLRQLYYNGRFGQHQTVGIDIVWCPSATPTGQEIPDDILDHDGDDDSSDGGDDDSDGGGDGDDGTANQPSNIDRHSGLTHNPQNDGGAHDQTAARGGRAHYQTRMIGGQNFTLDRARAQPNNRELHKTWLVDDEGHWNQYKKHATLDWTNSDDIERLNKWRDQQCQRHSWPSKRPVKRPDYSSEQKKFVFDKVKAAGGKKVSEIRFDELAAEFNRRFTTSRKIAGISSLFSRMMKQYNKSSDGEYHDGSGRGRRKRSRKDDDNDTEQPSTKKRRGRGREDPEEGDDEAEADQE